MDGLTDCEPDVVVDGVHEALQAVVFVELHVSNEEFPELIVVGLAAKLTVGTPGATTATVAESLAVPPGPVQAMSYVVVMVGLTDCEPAVAVEAVHEALQPVVFVELHVSNEEFPELIVVGSATKVTVGLGGVEPQSSEQLI